MTGLRPLYVLLAQTGASPIMLLNRAVAVAMVHGPKLDWPSSQPTLTCPVITACTRSEPTCLS